MTRSLSDLSPETTQLALTGGVALLTAATTAILARKFVQS